MKKRAIGYGRVSTLEQAEDGISLDVQKDRIKAYAKAKDLELIDVILDEGKSGKNLDRPGIEKLLQLADERKIDAIIVIRIDRLARKAIDFLGIIETFKNNDVDFHSITESLDSNTASGKLVMGILAQVAEYERELIRERILEALARKKRRGERLGTTPLGFKTVKNPKGGPGELIENPEEIEIVKEIKRGRGKGWSYPEICRYLNGRGYKTKRNKKWYPSTVSYIVKNPKFANIDISEEPEEPETEALEIEETTEDSDD